MNNRPPPEDSRSTAPPADLRHIVYLDPQGDRAVSPYSPEGEIQMMGDFAAGLSRRSVSRPVVLMLIAIILLPVLISVVAVLTTWLA